MHVSHLIHRSSSLGVLPEPHGVRPPCILEEGRKGWRWKILILHLVFLWKDGHVFAYALFLCWPYHSNLPPGVLGRTLPSCLTTLPVYVDHISVLPLNCSHSSDPFHPNCIFLGFSLLSRYWFHLSCQKANIFRAEITHLFCFLPWPRLVNTSWKPLQSSWRI